MPKRHPRTRFCKGALAVTKWCENTQNMTFRLNVVDWMCFGKETRKNFGWPGLVPKRQPRNRFCNGALATNKWCETTQNVSFGPKVVDWMHFGQKTRQQFSQPKLVPKRYPRTRFGKAALCCYQMVRNLPKHEFRT